MPFASNGAARLHWESFGTGPAVLLIAGQGMTVAAWWSTIPILERSFRVIAYDHRDTGRSSRSSFPYSVVQLAQDAAAVLDAAEEDHAHVYGVSLGSLVAQELALRRPDRVRRLVLGASSAGGFAAYKPSVSSFAQTFLVRAGAMGAEEAQWAAVPYTYAKRTRRSRPDRIAADIEHRLSSPPEALAYLHQAAAVAAHDAYERLNTLVAPTLVVHGEEDIFIPPANGVVLAERIPGAQLRLWPDAAHMYMIDQPAADEDIAAFLEGGTVAAVSPTGQREPSPWPVGGPERPDEAAGRGREPEPNTGSGAR